MHATIQPSESYDVMFDQLEWLIAHYAMCPTNKDCRSCDRFRRVTKDLMLPFVALRYVNKIKKKKV